jgi:hypothetical protein
LKNGEEGTACGIGSVEKLTAFKSNIPEKKLIMKTMKQLCWFRRYSTLTKMDLIKHIQENQQINSRT